MAMHDEALRNDFTSFLRGEEPTADVLAAAPKLEEWCTAVTRGPRGYCMTLMGIVVGHPILPDRKEIETPEVVWLDRDGKWARTTSALYKLGKAAGVKIPIDGIDM